MPRGLSKHASKGLTSAAGRGMRITTVQRITVARIGDLELDIEISNTADVAKGQIVDSEVGSAAVAPSRFYMHFV